VVFRACLYFSWLRYVEIEGYPRNADEGHDTGHSLIIGRTAGGSFHCSDSLFKAYTGGIPSYFSQQSFLVCSLIARTARKLGYGGDIVATSEAFMVNFNMHDLYAKTVRDFADDAQPDGALPETAPYVGIAIMGHPYIGADRVGNGAAAVA